MRVLPSLEEKASFVKRSFSDIAPHYDRANRAMTFGLDQGWRLKVVETVAPPVNGRALDVGTGTGDFLPLLAAWMPHGMVLGVDFCLPMMQAGWAKLDQVATRHEAMQVDDPSQPGQVAFVSGDALSLPFPDASFDAITTGFVMRNVTDIGDAFREMWRVTCPGGSVACLEVARPGNPVLRFGHWIYFQYVVPWIGGAISGNRPVYTYLPRSARNFPSPPKLAEIMRAAGWHAVHYQLLGSGAVALHRGVKR